MSKKSLNKVAEVLNASLKEVNGNLDANVIIGNPVKINENVTIIPVSKVTYGYLSGGGEYGDIKLISKERTHPFAGGSSGIVNMTPSGFLVVENGNYKYVKVQEDAFDKITDKALTIFENTVKK